PVPFLSHVSYCHDKSSSKNVYKLIQTKKNSDFFAGTLTHILIILTANIKELFRKKKIFYML
ncbi:MAG: hypothetical protein PHQ11_06680, partial [Paludibacter sp.]|nr:hypothetical protein [Paludibacter sp.]